MEPPPQDDLHEVEKVTIDVTRVIVKVLRDNNGKRTEL